MGAEELKEGAEARATLASFLGMLADLKDLAEQAGEPRIENPSHDSLALKFNQLESMLSDLVDRTSPGERWRATDALKLARVLRGQVLK